MARSKKAQIASIPYSELLTKSHYLRAFARFDSRSKLINKALDSIKKGQPTSLESAERRELFRERERELSEQMASFGKAETKNVTLGMESTIGFSKDILSIEFFEAGLLAAVSVGRVNVAFESEFGTGFLVGCGLMLTNNHVLPNEATAGLTTFELDLEPNRLGAEKSLQQFELDPKRFFFTSTALDFTLVAVAEQSSSGRALADYGYHPIIPRQGKIRIGDAVNIIQHPQGRLKSVVVHNSNLLHLENATEAAQYLWYTSDTEPGSSGSPVFNNRWEIVGLHHRALPKRDSKGRILSKANKPMTDAEIDADRSAIAWIANEGVRASKIVDAVVKADIRLLAQREIRDNLVKLWKNSRTGVFGMESKSAAGRAGAKQSVSVKKSALKNADSINLDITINLD